MDTQTPMTAQIAGTDPTPAATRVMLVEVPGQPAKLLLCNDSAALASLIVSPADAIALASDLLLSARRRMGRGHAG